MKSKIVVIALLLGMGYVQSSFAQGYEMSTFLGGPWLPRNVPSSSWGISPLAVMALDSAGNVYFTNGLPAVLKLDTLGNLTTVAGNGQSGYSGDGGPATQAELAGPPTGLAVDRSGNLFIADWNNNAIREVYAATGIIQTVVENGAVCYFHPCVDGGPATRNGIWRSQGVAVDGSGNIFILVGIDIEEVVAGTSVIKMVATFTPTEAPAAIFVDSKDNIFLVVNQYSCSTGLTGLQCQTTGSAIVEIVNGIPQTVAGNWTEGYGGDGGPATQAALNYPAGVAVDGSGNIFIADSSNHRIREVYAATGIIQTVAGNGQFGYSGEGGPATLAELYDPYGVSVDELGNILFTDSGLSGSRIREVYAATGIIQTMAGNGFGSYGGDGTTEAELSEPSWVALDALGDLFIADTGNQAIRRVAATTGIVSTVAGNGTRGYSGDGGPAIQAELFNPGGVSVDGSGNIVLADNGDDRIREVYAATGIIQTVAGNGTKGYSGDGGPATQAELNLPDSVFVDGSGNIFIADTGNNVVREVYAATGIIQTVAGNGTEGYSGDGGPATQAELNGPWSVFVDGSGNIFIADTGNHVIREVYAATGIIQTVVGGPATQAQLSAPAGVAIDGSGNIFISDREIGQIQVYYPATGTLSYIGSIIGTIQFGSAEPTGLALDSAGDIYVAVPYYFSLFSNSIQKLTPVDFQVAASPSAITVTAGQSGQTTLTMTPKSGFAQYVTFTCYGLPAQASCSAVSITPNGTAIKATLTISTAASTPPGTYAVNVTATTSGPLTVGVNLSLVVQAPPAPDFSTSFTALSPASVTPGGSATSTITIASLNGFTSSVSLSCSSITLNGTAAKTNPPTCSFSPSSVANGGGTSTLTIRTTASTTAALRPESARRAGWSYGMWLPMGGLALMGAGFCSRSGRTGKKLLSALLICLTLSGVVFLAACGGGTSGSGGGKGASGTPTGAYTITVKATAGSIVHTTNVELTVL